MTGMSHNLFNPIHEHLLFQFLATPTSYFFSELNFTFSISNPVFFCVYVCVCALLICHGCLESQYTI